jgi:ABC-type uncharacterized transport system permease subunit
MLDWEGLFKRYVWDDRTTPYLVPLSKLNRRQADNEILIYSLFVGVLFSIVAITALSEGTLHGRSPGIGLYGFSVVCACILFGFSKSYPAALYLSATPLAGLVYLFIYGFNSPRPRIDTIMVGMLLLVLVWYSLRLIALARAYEQFPEPGGDEKSPKRRLFKR